MAIRAQKSLSSFIPFDRGTFHVTVPGFFFCYDDITAFPVPHISVVDLVEIRNAFYVDSKSVRQ